MHTHTDTHARQSHDFQQRQPTSRQIYSMHIINDAPSIKRRHAYELLLFGASIVFAKNSLRPYRRTPSVQPFQTWCFVCAHGFVCKMSAFKLSKCTNNIYFGLWFECVRYSSKEKRGFRQFHPNFRFFDNFLMELNIAWTYIIIILAKQKFVNINLFLNQFEMSFFPHRVPRQSAYAWNFSRANFLICFQFF